MRPAKLCLRSESASAPAPSLCGALNFDALVDRAPDGNAVISCPDCIAMLKQGRGGERRGANKPEPAPIPNAGPAIWPLVIADMRDRDNAGRAKYGTPLQSNNGRDPLIDAYQEALDLAVYLRQAIEERGALIAPGAGPSEDEINAAIRARCFALGRDLTMKSRSPATKLVLQLVIAVEAALCGGDALQNMRLVDSLFAEPAEEKGGMP